MPSSTPGRILTTLRFAIGGGTWLTPRPMGRLFGLDPEANPQVTYVARLFAIRNVVLGYGLAATEGDVRRLFWTAGVVVDAMDAAASLLAMRNGEVGRGSGLMLTGTALLATGLGAAALAADDT